jgi:glycine/D-amino acid oxidase-like deaminating enzyme
MPSGTAVIIGAGVTGLSTAYHLALKNFGRIVVLEKGPIGDGSSSRAAGIITGLMWSETGVRARKISLDRFEQLSTELPGYTFQQAGCLNWFDQTSWRDREKLLPLYDSCGVKYEILSPVEMRRRWPEMDPPEDFVGLHDPRGGFSEPDEYIPALANQCRRLGVEFLEWTRVDSLLMSRGQVSGLKTATGVIECDQVVCTNFAWMNLTLATIGVQLPAKAFVHQRYTTRSLLNSPNLPAVNANPLGGYVRPAIGRRLLLGLETADREEFRVRASAFHLSELSTAPGLRDRFVCQFQKAFCGLRAAEWESQRVGLITFSADGEPILGPIPQVPGLFVGVAFHSGGFAYSPVAGMLLAEFVTNGKTSLDVSSFSPGRFAASETAEYLQTTVPQRNVVRRRH